MTLVWFCLACDDQPPWKAEILRPCLTCASTAEVKRAQPFGNLTTDAAGNPHQTDRIERP